jgi:mannose-6-phosphate isomerase
VSGWQKTPEPFRIEPVFYPRIWGARSLTPLFREKANLPEPIGEAWLTSVDCKIGGGPYAGKTLGEAWREMPAGWRGSDFRRPGDFPLLVKFIFPNDKLSIQVHPDDAYAAAHEQAAGGRGKTEMWHVVSAGPGASLLLGLKPGVTRESLLAALKNQTLEDLFQRHAVQVGDTYFVPAGTPHTIGPDMVICEVQEYSDITYRVYDYGRVDATGKPRDLHVDKALAVINLEAVRKARTLPLTVSRKDMKMSVLAACKYFEADKLEISSTTVLGGDTGAFHLLIVLSGSGQLAWKNNKTPYLEGECWFIPARLLYLSVLPDKATSMLRVYVPDLLYLLEQLDIDGFSQLEVSQTVFE